MELSSSAGQFSDELTQQLITKSHTGNALVSPLSLLTALSMLLVGSKGSTRASLSSALKLPSNVSQDTVDSFYNKLISAYEKQSNDETKFIIKNKMLVAQGYVKDSPLLPSYEATVREKYHAGIEAADFVNEGLAVKEKVNAWVNESTEGLIKSLLDEPPSSDTVFILLNSLFFQSLWTKKFGRAYDRTFFLEGEKNKTTKFMGVQKRFKYLEILVGSSNGTVQVVEVPYQTGASMVFLLPPESTSLNSLFEQRLVYTMSRQVVNEGGRRYIDLHVPKFKFDTKLKMKECLQSMGAGDLFSSPDLSGINGANNLRVSNVTHVTGIEVTEKGTRAAAITGIEVLRISSIVPLEEPLQVVLDRPFAFVIYDTVNHLPIFVGKLGDPVAP